MRNILLVGALVGCGCVGGYLFGALHDPLPVATPPPQVAAARPAERIVVAPGGLSEAELRRVVQEELAARRPEDPRPATATAAAGDAHAYDVSMGVVSHALAQHQWTPDDAARLARTLALLSPEQRTTVLHTLVPALNRGEITPTYRGAVFQ